MTTVSLRYEEFGTPELPPLIILHGFLASSRNWCQIAKALSGVFHVFVPDLRNHGLSPHHPEMDYPDLTADLSVFISGLGLGKVSILGHSMGGKVAMWYALNHSDKLEHLIVIDIAPVTYSHSFKDVLQALKNLPIEQLTNRKQADEVLAAKISDPGFRQFLLQNLVLNEGAYGWRINLDIFLQTAPNITQFPDTSHLAPYLNKALFIGGVNSTYMDPASIYSLFPQAGLERVQNAGHWVHAEQPAQLIELIIAHCQ